MTVPAYRARVDGVAAVPPIVGLGESLHPRTSSFDRVVGAVSTNAPTLLDLEDTANWAGIDVPPRRWLLEGWFPVGEAAFLTGPGAVGKSLVAQQLAATLAAGKPFMGVPVERAISIYITCEDGPDELRRRQAAIAGTIGGYGDHGRCLAQSWKGQLDNDLVTFDAERRMKPTDRYQQLRATALATGARLIVLDNTSHLFGGDENVKREVAAFVNLLNGLAAEIDGVVLLLGHPNKSGVNDRGASAGNQFGGSVAWENQVRSRLFLSTDGDDADARVLTNPKANYASKGEGRLCFRWHKGAFVREADLGEDVAREVRETAAAARGNAAFLACLAVRNGQERPVSESPTAPSTYAPKVFAAMDEAKGFKPSELEAAMDRLFRLGRIKRGVVCRTGRKDREGLVECADPRADPAPTRCADMRSPGCADMRSPTPPYYVGEGGPAESPAPSYKIDPARWQSNPAPARRGPVLAPGETGDEPIPGWE